MSSPSPGWSQPEPMRAVPVTDPTLPVGWAAQPKWDGYRALASRWADGRVAVRSRNGSDLARAFPEIEEAVRRLPDDTATDCELIVWEAGRLAFERLQQRMHQCPFPGPGSASVARGGALLRQLTWSLNGLSATRQPRCGRLAKQT